MIYFNLSSLFSLCRWYQIKITMRWEDSENTSIGTPARVVQYVGMQVFPIQVT